VVVGVVGGEVVVAAAVLVLGLAVAQEHDLGCGTARDYRENDAHPEICMALWCEHECA